jgi:hypothetical protein
MVAILLSYYYQFPLFHIAPLDESVQARFNRSRLSLQIFCGGSDTPARIMYNLTAQGGTTRAIVPILPESRAKSL